MGSTFAVKIVVGALVFLVVWAMVARLVIWLFRPRLPNARATPDLVETPPAVVNLMAHGFIGAPEAAAATLLDLAARGYVTLEQPGIDPSETVVRVVRDGVAGLSPYEQRVLDRVSRPPGVEPFTLADLARRHARDGQEWNDRLEQEVRADADHRGLVDAARTHPAMVILIVGLMFVVLLGCLAGPAVTELLNPAWAIGKTPSILLLAVMGLAAFALLCALIAMVGKIPDERYTPAGRALARRWGGVARWLRGHEAFAELPPASVTVWDRYLAYGVALLAAPAAAAQIDLRVGRVDLVHSSYGERPRLVRVHYPRQGGLRAAPSGVRLFFAVFGGLTLLAVLWSVRERLLALPPTWKYVAVAIVAILLVRSAYRIVRSASDMLLPATVTGRVLRVVPFGTFGDPKSAPIIGAIYDSKSLSWLFRHTGRPVESADGSGLTPAFYLVIDDGKSATLRARIVRPKVAVVVRPGDLITARAQRWSGNITRVTAARS